jgi:hypothetical protein
VSRCQQTAHPETFAIVETEHLRPALVSQGSTLAADWRRSQYSTGVSLACHQMRRWTIEVSDCPMALVGWVAQGLGLAVDVVSYSRH